MRKMRIFGRDSAAEAPVRKMRIFGDSSAPMRKMRIFGRDAECEYYRSGSINFCFFVINDNFKNASSTLISSEKFKLPENMWNFRMNPTLFAFCFLLLLFVATKTFFKGKPDSLPTKYSIYFMQKEAL